MHQCFKYFPPSHIHTKLFAFQFNIFTSYTSTLLYTTYPLSFMLSYVKYTNKKRCYLPSIFWKHLPSSNIIVSFNLGKGVLHFILSDNGNYDFDVKVRCCGLMDLIKPMIDCRCLRCWCRKAKSVFCFRIKNK